MCCLIWGGSGVARAIQNGGMGGVVVVIYYVDMLTRDRADMIVLSFCFACFAAGTPSKTRLPLHLKPAKPLASAVLWNCHCNSFPNIQSIFHASSFLTFFFFAFFLSFCAIFFVFFCPHTLIRFGYNMAPSLKQSIRNMNSGFIEIWKSMIEISISLMHSVSIDDKPSSNMVFAKLNDNIDNTLIPIDIWMDGKNLKVKRCGIQYNLFNRYIIVSSSIEFDLFRYNTIECFF